MSNERGGPQCLALPLHSSAKGGLRGDACPPYAHPPADVLGAQIVRAAARNGAVRLRINDALDAGTPLNCVHAVPAGGGGVQFAVRQADNVERDALTPVLFLFLLLLFINFFDGRHLGMAAPPNGGRCAARGVKAARNDLAVHDRNASVLHANRRFVGLLHCQANEPRVTVSHG